MQRCPGEIGRPLQPRAGPYAGTGAGVTRQQRLEGEFRSQLVPQHLAATDRQPGLLGGCIEALTEGQAGEEGEGGVQVSVAGGAAVGQIGIGRAVLDVEANAAVGGHLDTPHQALGPEADGLRRVLRGQRQQSGAGQDCRRRRRVCGCLRGRDCSTGCHGRRAGGLEEVAPIHADPPCMTLFAASNRIGSGCATGVRPLAGRSLFYWDDCARGLTPYYSIRIRMNDSSLKKLVGPQ